MLQKLEPPKEETKAAPPEAPKVGPFARMGRWLKGFGTETPRTAVAMA